MAKTEHLLPVEQGKLPLTIERASGRGAAVVIMPSAFGVARDVQAQMEELAEDASLVVAFDPFFRGDAGPASYDDMPRVMARLQAIDRERCGRDLAAAISWARAESGRPVVVLGVCFGGPFALLAAADRLVDGVVTWHGTRMENFLSRAADVQCPMRLHFGSADPLVPAKAIEALRNAFGDRENVEIFVHDGAAHGFSHPDAKAYDERAERASVASLRELVRSL